MDGQYVGLQRIASLCRILAILLFAGAFLVGIALAYISTIDYDANFSIVQRAPNFGPSLLVILLGSLLGIGLFAVGGMIRLLLDIEANTRAILSCLRRRE